MKKYLVILVVLVAALCLVLAPVALGEAVDAAPPARYVDLTPIFQAIIALLAAIVTTKVIPWLQSRTTQRQQEMMRAAVSVAVYAAEQIYGASEGKQKLLYVKGQLAKKGYSVDIDEIEAAVRDLKINGGEAYPNEVGLIE